MIDIKREIETSMGRFSRQKINKEVVALDDMLNQMDLLDIFRVIHPKVVTYTFFLSPHGTLGHKTSLNKFKKVKITSGIFSDHNNMKLEINHKKKKLKYTQSHKD